jgi:hypothetical protein
VGESPAALATSFSVVTFNRSIEEPFVNRFTKAIYKVGVNSIKDLEKISTARAASAVGFELRLDLNPDACHFGRRYRKQPKGAIHLLDQRRRRARRPTELVDRATLK